MTTYYPVSISTTGAPQFVATFDEAQYTIQVRWNLFGQRYFVFCFDDSGDQVFSRPLMKSLVSLEITSISYDELSGLVGVITDEPHGYRIGSTKNLTISGASPDAYNGTFLMLVTGLSTLSFPLQVTSNPGSSTIGGTLGYLISMTAGYFNSTLVYRGGQFEVSP